MDSGKMREQFEAWFSEQYPDTEDRQKDFRMSSASDLMFAAWCAALSAQPQGEAVALADLMLGGIDESGEYESWDLQPNGSAIEALQESLVKADGKPVFVRLYAHAPAHSEQAAVPEGMVLVNAGLLSDCGRVAVRMKEIGNKEAVTRDDQHRLLESALTVKLLVQSAAAPSAPAVNQQMTTAPAVPVGWMRDVQQVNALKHHLENQAWGMSDGGPVLIDQAYAMAAEALAVIAQLADQPAPDATKEGV